MEHSLKNEADHLGLRNDVVFRDANTQKDLRLLYQACDLNLYPVRNQTYGLVPFEVLAAGKPSIVSDECGAADVIGSEKIGFLIKPNVKELADTVLFALKHDELVEDMVQERKAVRAGKLDLDKTPGTCTASSGVYCILNTSNRLRRVCTFSLPKILRINSPSFCQISLTHIKYDGIDGTVVCGDAEHIPFRTRQ